MRTPGDSERARALIGRAYYMTAQELIMRIYSGDESLTRGDVEDGHCYFCLQGICCSLPGSKVSWENGNGTDSVRICTDCYSVALDDSVLNDN